MGKTADKILVLNGVKKAEHTWMYIHDDGELSMWEDDMIFVSNNLMVISDVLKKAYFVLASFCGVCYDDNDGKFHLIHENDSVMPIINEVTNVLREFDSRFKRFEFRAYRHFDFESGDSFEIEYFMGAIKLESKNLLKSFLDSHNLSIKEFILNHNYVVVIDNELNWYQKFKDWNFIDMKMVKEEFDVEV